MHNEKLEQVDTFIKLTIIKRKEVYVKFKKYTSAAIKIIFYQMLKEVKMVVHFCLLYYMEVRIN